MGAVRTALRPEDPTTTQPLRRAALPTLWRK
jgi:hypothetical protein